jgi:hypothetical protein
VLLYIDTFIKTEKLFALYSKEIKMFLNLPSDIQENIYDRLHIKDRVKLNIALPRKDRITRTIKTNQKKDKELGMAYYFFKKRKDKVNVMSSIYRFVKKNIDDPTCGDILKDLHQKTVENKQTEEAGESNQDINISMIISQIEEELENNNMPLNLFDKLPENIEYRHCSYLQDIILRSNRFSVDKIRQLINYPSALKLLRLVFSGYDIIFTIINYRDEGVLREVLENRDLLGITDSQIDYVRRKEIATIFDRKNCIEMIVKHIHVSYDVQQAWLEKALERCNIELAEWLMKDHSITL